MPENFPSLARDINLEIQEAEWHSQSEPKEIHTRQISHQSDTSEKLKNKEKNLKCVKREKTLAYKGKWFDGRFLIRKYGDKKEVANIFKILKGKNF